MHSWLYRAAVPSSLMSLLGCVLPGPAGASSSQIVDTGYASYLGNLAFPNSVAYLGIPYAEPPVGDGRFRKALPLNTTRIKDSSQGKLIDATEYPDFCIQGTTGGGDAGGAGSEDCLKVNIYAPPGVNEDSKLPVLVYIHGGGYVYGNPRNWPFELWVRQSPNVVIVSVYYRLDSFGFLTHPTFTDGEDGDLNAGFQDQTEALRWIQDYIGAFGGDKTQVTINGESAGGSSIELHLVAKGSRELFSQAIAQSVYRTPLPTPEQQESLFNFYAQEAGCGISNFREQMACLRSASVTALARAQDAAYYNFMGYNLFHPVVDGKIIVQVPTESLEAGNFARVPLIVGSTSNETLSSASVHNSTTIEEALKTYFPSLATSELQQYPKVYPESEFSSAAQRYQVATGESELICARAIMGTAFSKATGGKTWAYRYNQVNPTGADLLSVGHAAENWMMFNGSNTGVNGTGVFTGLNSTEQAFAQELIAYWLSFVRGSDPNKYKLPQSPTWPSYTESSGRERIVLQQVGEPGGTNVTGSYVEQEPELETTRCEFIASLVKSQQN